MYRELPLYKMMFLKQEKKRKEKKEEEHVASNQSFNSVCYYSVWRVDGVKLHRWGCTRWTRGTFYGGPSGTNSQSYVARISQLVLRCFVCQYLRYVHQIRPFSGLPVRVRRHARFCVHKVEMSPLGVWHWWVSLHGTPTALLAASVGIFSANAQAWQTKPVVACRFRSHASEPLWKYSAPVGQLCVKPESQIIC